MPAADQPGNGFLPVAEIAIDAVEPVREGFRLLGRGADASDYRLDMHLDVPVDQRTRTVLSELLAQTEWRLWRRARQPINPKQGRQLGRSGTRSRA